MPLTEPVPKDATRVLNRWGLADRLKEVGATPVGLQFHRCEFVSFPLQFAPSRMNITTSIDVTGEVVGFTPTGDLVKAHGSPYYNVNVSVLTSLPRSQ